MNQEDWPSFLFNGVTDHWVKVDITGESQLIKFRPLSLKEKLNIINKYRYEEDPMVQQREIMLEQCKLMLVKAYGESFDPDNISFTVLSKIYQCILVYISDRRQEVEEFYNANKSALIETKKSHTKDNLLNTLVNYGNLIKGCYLSLSDLADLDEISMFTLMCYMEEDAVRESNMYARSKQEQGKK